MTIYKTLFSGAIQMLQKPVLPQDLKNNALVLHISNVRS